MTKCKCIKKPVKLFRYNIRLKIKHLCAYDRVNKRSLLSQMPSLQPVWSNPKRHILPLQTHVSCPVWACPHAMHDCRGHLLKWWVANSSRELRHMAWCYTQSDRLPYTHHPPLHRPPPSACNPAGTPLWQLPWWMEEPPRRVNLHSWIMHAVMPPRHPASLHGVRLEYMGRNQDISLFLSPRSPHR